MRSFHYMILALYICYCYAESSVLYIYPTDHLSNNVTGRNCPQNLCGHTLNELVGGESNLSLELPTTKIIIVLLPGVHIINTTDTMPDIDIIIRNSGTITITGDSKVTVWCTNRIITFAFYAPQVEIFNIEFKSCGQLHFLSESNIEVRDVIIDNEQGDGGIVINPNLCTRINNTIFLYNLKITLNGIGIEYIQNCDPPDDECCTHTGSTSLFNTCETPLCIWPTSTWMQNAHWLIYNK